jgi:pSer/pThr/pTyr-binding forkhead associated (FHA) protein
MGAFAGAEKMPRSFLCSNDLWGAFERRASDLECSVDWLICEAMKRLLESGPGAGSQPRQTVARPHQPQQQQQQLRPPLPKPRPPSLPPKPPQPRRPRQLAFVIDGQPPISLDSYAADRDSAIVIGRSPKEAQLVLRDPGVSRQHAMVERNSMTGGLVIVDMASTNGVILNGQRVARAALRAGDRIEIGPFTIDVVV